MLYTPPMRRVNTGISLAPDILAKLNDIARHDARRTRNQIIETALDEYVSRHWSPALASTARATETVRPPALPPGGSLRADGEREGAHT